MRHWIGVLLALLVAPSGAAPAEASARPVVYSVHLGINAPPAGSELPALRFADDDAVRFYRFARLFAKRSFLVTVLDDQSQRANPDLVDHCTPPQLGDLENLLKELAAEVAADRVAGHRVVVYFSYSGHGVREGRDTTLTLLDGPLNRAFLAERVLAIPADQIHLFIDACHGQGLLEDRGAIRREASAASVPVDPAPDADLLQPDLLARHPNTGALVAAASDRESHEWSQLQAGVFTYELVSALSGAADVNADGEVAYSEASAFISSANREVKDPRAALEVVARPPAMNRNAPIVALSWIPSAATLEGVPAGLGHFYLETEFGQRVLDAHPEATGAVRLVVPPAQRLWLRAGDCEAAFASAPGHAVRFADLRLQAFEPLATRGSTSEALRRGFFALPFGPAYYLGYVDKTGEVNVPFGNLPMVQVTAAEPGRAPSIACLVGSGLALASTAVFTGLALQADHDY